jgi:alkylation response protein AidB-like acyl-CoA dehydrogenase
MLQNGDHVHDATIAEVLVSTPAQSIAGGTDQIQRSIIGEKILGLPRDASN